MLSSLILPVAESRINVKGELTGEEKKRLPDADSGLGNEPSWTLMHAYVRIDQKDKSVITRCTYLGSRFLRPITRLTVLRAATAVAAVEPLAWTAVA